MQSISNLASGVSKAVWGENATQQQQQQPADTEPTAGETGKGTATEPFDAGNAPEQEQATTATSTTPAPAATESSSPERPNNARQPSFALKETATGSVAEPNSAPVQDDQAAAAAKPLAEPTSAAIVNDTRNPSDFLAEANKDENAAYGTASPFDAAKESAPSDSRLLRAEQSGSHSPERSISPGARADGSHAQTGKSEKPKFSSKLKEKLHIGSSKH